MAWLAWVCAAACVIYVVGAPLWAAEYPMMTDFPFHAASSSVLRHYLDPAWHFSDQFVFRPFAVPQVSLYVLAAFLMLAFPPVVATKLAAGVFLSLMPLGLMALCWGLKKSPLLGLWGLVLVWGVVTHWGFISYVGALGLFAIGLGLALRVAETPSVVLQGLLTAVLVLLFLTDVFRFPSMLFMLLVVALVMRPRVETLRGLVVPAAVAVLLFGTWWATRPEPLSAALGWVRLPDWGRALQIDEYAFDVFVGDDDAEMFARVGLLLLVTAAVLFTAATLRLRSWPKGSYVFPAHVVVSLAILLFLGLYFTLPLEKEVWWYVFPREITAALFLLPALLPNLPRKTWAHLGFVVWTAVAMAPLTEHVAEAHREFGATTVHFREILRELPRAPKLLYLVYDHAGSRAQSSPYVHLPAYTQAERGGWLSYHFAQFGFSPFRYRDRNDVEAQVPPPTPVRWEWSPQLFHLDEHGAFFDWFLVRREGPPDELFAADPTIARVAHFERWWLYHRRGGSTGPPGESP